LEFLTRTFVNVPNIIGIQLLNEPAQVPQVWDFYNTALDALRAVTPEAQSFPFYLHDAFDLQKGASYVMGRGREWNVLDHHACTPHPIQLTRRSSEPYQTMSSHHWTMRSPLLHTS
jgi:aryl-phospho-beta-D-glucosidase BglC (GH1 family)